MALYNLCVRQNWLEALELQKKLWPVNEMFSRYNLAACLKAGLEELGHSVGSPILPQRPLPGQARAEIATALRSVL